MYVRYVTFRANSAQRRKVEVLSDRVFALMKTLNGFISVHFVIFEEENEYGSFSLWESKVDAIAAGDSIRANIGNMIQDIAPAAPKIKLYEVYKPE